MICSANEVQTLADKAARGAGAHAAQAAHFGRATVRHLAAGRAAGVLVAALDALPGGPIQTLPFAPDTTPLGESYTDLHRPARMPARLEVDDALLTRLRSLAARTYVPSSDRSRETGAGAGACAAD